MVGNIRKELKIIEDLLAEEARWDCSKESLLANRGLVHQRNHPLLTEETMWRQRRRALRLNQGDKNMKFFHGKAEQRRNTNKISKLKDGNGHWWKGTYHCEQILLSFFFDLFKSSNLATVESVFEVVKDRLSSKNVLHCEEDFKVEEIREAFFQMHPLKAPEPDGLPCLFFQKYWHIVGTKVT